MGGEGGIRTHGQLAPTLVFKTSALVHYATSPVAEAVRFELTRALSAQGFSKPSQWTSYATPPWGSLYQERRLTPNASGVRTSYDGNRAGIDVDQRGFFMYFVTDS